MIWKNKNIKSVVIFDTLDTCPGSRFTWYTSIYQTIERKLTPFRMCCFLNGRDQMQNSLAIDILFEIFYFQV